MGEGVERWNVNNQKCCNGKTIRGLNGMILAEQERIGRLVLYFYCIRLISDDFKGSVKSRRADY